MVIVAVVVIMNIIVNHRNKHLCYIQKSQVFRAI